MTLAVHSLVEKVRSSERDRVDELCVWLLAHLHEPIGWGKLVAQSNMSHEELGSAFDQHFQVSPMEWVTQQRTAKLMSAQIASGAQHANAQYKSKSSHE